MMPGNASHAVNAAPILNDCCAKSAACRLHLLHSGQFADAKFHDASGAKLVVHVTHCDRDEDLQPDALCCVAFPFQSSMYAFLDCVKNVRDGAAELEVHFAMPSVLTATNLRQSFRVPIVRAAGIQLEMRLPDGTRISGEALNLSEAGIEIDLGRDDARLSVDTEVQFEMRFRDECFEIPAVVRRRQQSRRALKFASSHAPDSRQRLASLQRLVRSLEQLWLKNRHA